MAQKVAASTSSIAMSDLMKALRLVKKAKENNVPLGSWNESLVLEQLSNLKPKKRSCWVKVRWTVYVISWILAIAYFVALLNREQVCPLLSEE